MIEKKLVVYLGGNDVPNFINYAGESTDTIASLKEFVAKYCSLSSSELVLYEKKDGKRVISRNTLYVGRF